MRYGSASTAYHAGCDTICTVRPAFWRVGEWPEFKSLVNSNCFTTSPPPILPRIGKGSDSVRKTRRDSTGK